MMTIINDVAAKSMVDVIHQRVRGLKYPYLVTAFMGGTSCSPDMLRLIVQAGAVMDDFGDLIIAEGMK